MLSQAARDALQYVRENDVKFIRLTFCDIFGNVKNISIQADRLQHALEYGICLDACSVQGFAGADSEDLFLFPDPTTMAALPWRPSRAGVIRFFCDIRYRDGRHFERDSRYQLKKAVRRCKEMGYQCKIGSKCEFYLFLQDDKGNPTLEVQDRAGYLDVAPLDRVENIRREICLNLEQMGIKPECSYHEHGPGQNEVDFRDNNALGAADDLISFKLAVRSIANINGLYGSFLPKPMEHLPGSGLHVNINLFKDGENIFLGGEQHNPVAESFIAGILKYIRDITCFLNPLSNSYARFGEFEAPKYISWCHQNRFQLIRIPAASPGHNRMELRSPDSACNPYLAFALLIHAGLEGIEENLALPAPTNLDLFTATPEETAGLELLPQNLGEALDCARNSAFVKKHLDAGLLESYLANKQKEWDNAVASPNRHDYELRNYFLYV